MQDEFPVPCPLLGLCRDPLAVLEVRAGNQGPLSDLLSSYSPYSLHPSHTGLLAVPLAHQCVSSFFFGDSFLHISLENCFSFKSLHKCHFFNEPSLDPTVEVTFSPSSALWPCFFFLFPKHLLPPDSLHNLLIMASIPYLSGSPELETFVLFADIFELPEL